MKNEQTALITGATSGIGYELAKIFASKGYRLILIARSPAELNDTKNKLKSYGVTIHLLAKDLFLPDAAQEIYADVKELGLKIDVLVNDAGQGVYGYFWETELEREYDIIQLNITALVTLTKLYLKEMVARNDGKILQLASMVSRSPSPLMAVYAGTKAFVYNFTQSIIAELRDKDSKVTVTALLPGATETDFFYKAGAQNTVTWQEADLASPADVAQDGFDALMAGEPKVVSGTKNKIQDALGNITPEQKVADNMLKQMKESDQANQ
jgi:short-subunit dehydrogenase